MPAAPAALQESQRTGASWFPSTGALETAAFLQLRACLGGRLGPTLASVNARKHPAPRDRAPARMEDGRGQVGRPCSRLRTRSGVIGNWRMRAPVASKKALGMGAAVAPIASSPAPVD